MTSLQDRNLGQLFTEAAERHAAFPAFVSEHRVLNYLQFQAIVVCFARRMKKRGVGRGSLVAVNTSDAVVSVGTLLATALLGAQFIAAGKLLAQTRAFAPSHFLRSPEAAGSPHVPFELIDASWGPNESSLHFDDAEFNGPESLDDPWLILHTSGSTGQPKFLNLSQAVAIRRTWAIASDFPTRGTTLVSLYGNTTRPFFARAMGALLNGCTIVDSPNPEIWKKTGVNLVCGSPHAAAQFFYGKTFEPRIERLEVAGAKLEDSVADDLMKCFDKIIDVYGAGETNKTYCVDHSRAADGTRQAVGRIYDGTLQIVNDAGQVCAAGEVGALRVRTDYMVDGYVNNPEATARAFRDGWFYSGDLASWAEDGGLKLVGREDDIINLGGPKINAQLVDFVMETVPGVRAAACFKNPKPEAADELLAFVELEDLSQAATCLEEARAVCVKQLGFAFAPRRVRAINKIPRNEKGTPARHICQEVLLERYLDSKPKV